MKDITNVKLIYLKGILFLSGGLMTSVILLVIYPSLVTAGLLAAVVWCFARAYYFAFYVIEHYIDDSYKFSGLCSFARYLYRRRTREG